MDEKEMSTEQYNMGQSIESIDRNNELTVIEPILQAEIAEEIGQSSKIKRLRNAIEVHEQLSILSNRHPSIANVVANVYPECQHGICIYHMEKNLRKRYFSDVVLSLFYNAATTYKHTEFYTFMDEMEKIDKVVAEYLKEEELKRRAHSFHTNRRTAPVPVVGWPPVHSFRKNLASSSSVKLAAKASQNMVPSKSANEKPTKIYQKGLFAKINMGDLKSLNVISVYT
ncbi:hypothetical protein FXO38_13908 [Capsicum annuum]|nr:hypothetical protein FXO37_16403 [Capsicum annuum]KAF3656953.1 hypothetical protein FXO38_13908 [Capsicum annuum]